jgi:hypothetical protein
VTRNRDRGGRERRRSVSVTAAAYARLEVAARERGVPIAALVDEMIAAAEIEEQRTS